MTRALVQLQLSNYNREGQFDLACDSGWQMCINRCRELLKLDPDLYIDFIGPNRSQLVDQPEDVNPDMFEDERGIHYIETYIMPNAPATRYDFSMEDVEQALCLQAHKLHTSYRYDWVYVNDPCLLPQYRAMFHLKGGYLPKFFVHSHFVDCPNNPKFPTEISLWLRQCEAAIKADFNFWQCQSALDEFLEEMEHWFTSEHVYEVASKSAPWDDGYSINEMRLPINHTNIRFDVAEVEKLITGKTVIFIPNRIGGGGRSSDYTQCGRFMFDVLPDLWKANPGKFIVFAGNPNQKFSNDELVERCGQYGYVKLVEGSFNRDEYRWLAKTLGERADLALGWYTQDTFGGTASRELVEMGMMPAWVDKFEYKSLADKVAKTYLAVTDHLVEPDFSDAVKVLTNTLNLDERIRMKFVAEYQRIIRERSSFEQTTPVAFEIMKRICNVV